MGRAALFRHVILLGGALLLAGCSGGAGACRQITEENLIPVSPELPDAATGDGGLENLLVLCEADMSNCTRLCQAALPPTPDGSVLDECQLERVDGGFAVHVVYHWRQCQG